MNLNWSFRPGRLNPEWNWWVLWCVWLWNYADYLENNKGSLINHPNFCASLRTHMCIEIRVRKRWNRGPIRRFYDSFEISIGRIILENHKAPLLFDSLFWIVVGIIVRKHSNLDKIHFQLYILELWPWCCALTLVCQWKLLLNFIMIRWPCVFKTFWVFNTLLSSYWLHITSLTVHLEVLMSRPDHCTAILNSRDQLTVLQYTVKSLI